MAYSIETVPKWTAEVKSKYGKADTKFACVGCKQSEWTTIDC